MPFKRARQRVQLFLAARAFRGDLAVIRVGRAWYQLAELARFVERHTNRTRTPNTADADDR
jgi:hypothetical protein